MSFSSIPLSGWITITALLALLLVLIVPVGNYIARVFMGERTFLTPFAAPLERLILRAAGIQSDQEMGWKTYLKAILIFSALGFVVLFTMLMAQPVLSMTPDLAFNIAVSFVTNTNWQSYAPETTTTSIVQMLGLTVQNFLSASVGLCVLLVLIRGLTRSKTSNIGNFWVDLTRSVLYILLPLTTILAIFLVTQGSVQTFGDSITIMPLETQAGQQTIFTGPVASTVAIKQLGVNGSGFFTVSGAHPFETPTPLSNFIQILAMLLIPASLTITFGKMTGNMRQGYTLLLAMLCLYVPLTLLSISAETSGNPLLTGKSISQALGNMEGKELRIGAIGSALSTSTATATSAGSANSAIDSYMPLSTFIFLTFMQLGGVIFGGIGCGLYGMLVYVFFAVFISGLMIGRTPEYLGKKISVFETKMASLVIIIPAFTALLGIAIAVQTQAGPESETGSNLHAFSQILYSFTSTSYNNGSAMAGIEANTAFYNNALGLCMLLGRFGPICVILALAGSFAQKITTSPNKETLDTTSSLFRLVLILTLIFIGFMTFVPTLVLGPIGEHFRLISGLP